MHRSRRSQRSRHSVDSGWAPVPGRRWARIRSAAAASDSPCGWSACRSTPASRSKRPTPTWTWLPSSGSSTTRTTSRPATSPRQIPCSTIGSTPTPRHRSSNPTGAPGGSTTVGVSAGATSTSRRPSTRRMSGAGRRAAARRVASAAASRSSKQTVIGASPNRTDRNTALPRARSGSSSSASTHSRVPSKHWLPSDSRSDAGSPIASDIRARNLAPRRERRRSGSRVTGSTARQGAGPDARVQPLRRLP